LKASPGCHDPAPKNRSSRKNTLILESWPDSVRVVGDLEDTSFAEPSTLTRSRQTVEVDRENNFGAKVTPTIATDNDE
jgi:hypothetical protein